MLNSVRDAFKRRLGQILSSPQVAALARDERVMKLLMTVLQASGKAQKKRDELLRRVAKSLRLATDDDMRELRRTIRKLEDDLAKTKDEGPGRRDGSATRKATA